MSFLYSKGRIFTYQMGKRGDLGEIFSFLFGGGGTEYRLKICPRLIPAYINKVQSTSLLYITSFSCLVLLTLCLPNSLQLSNII